MLSAAEARSIPVDGVHMEVEADSAKHPERVEKIRMVITLPEGIAQDDVESLERVAGHCKVHTTIVRVPEISLEVRVGSPQ